MKSKMLCVLLFTFYLQNNAQISFQDHIIIDDTGATNGAKSVFAVDIDGDGDMDMLSASALDDKIAWYENTDGSGTFGPQQIISTNANGANVVVAADIDLDGDMDVISSSRNDDKITWYENNGLGVFSTEQIITLNADSIRSIYVADLDGDGDMDIVSASSNDDKIAWYKNLDGQGAFSTEQIISTAETSPNAVYVSDIDGDGDMDIISVYWNDKIAWFENVDGMGTFGAARIITSEANGNTSVYVSDIDGDGDMDVISTLNGIKVVWYENIDGNGNFGSQKIVFTSSSRKSFVYSDDIDNDGDMDIISNSGSNKIAWYENTDGNGTFGTEQIISENVDGVTGVYTADIDGDGNIDILSASTYDDKIAWYKNTDGLGAFGEQQVLVSIVGVNGPYKVFSVDIDGDGDNDILSASTNDDKIAWYENTDGQGTFGPQQIISTDVDYAGSVFGIDIDNDGDVDVLSASYRDNKVAWYENTDGQGTFSAQQIISSNFDGAITVFSKDIDGDGDMDVLSSSAKNGNIVWFKNLDGLGTFSTAQVITTDALFAESIISIDLDNDGDADVLSASYGDDKVAWYENTDGLGNFGPQQIISSDVLAPESVYAEDIDGDGDMDVLSASYGDDKIAWYENTDGLGTFGAQQIISTIENRATSVYAGDIDNDGDMDICVTAISENSISWYENTDGLGTFGSRQIISSNLNGIDIILTDINNDEKLDVVSASYGLDQLTWHENLGRTLSMNENTLLNFTIYPIPTTETLKITSETSIVKIEIYNKLGQRVLKNTDKNNINISNLSTGLYICKATGVDGSVGIRKVIKK